MNRNDPPTGPSDPTGTDTDGTQSTGNTEGGEPGTRTGGPGESGNFVVGGQDQKGGKGNNGEHGGNGDRGDNGNHGGGNWNGGPDRGGWGNSDHGGQNWPGSFGGGNNVGGNGQHGGGLIPDLIGGLGQTVTNLLGALSGRNGDVPPNPWSSSPDQSRSGSESSNRTDQPLPNGADRFNPISDPNPIRAPGESTPRNTEGLTRNDSPQGNGGTSSASGNAPGGYSGRSTDAPIAAQGQAYSTADRAADAGRNTPPGSSGTPTAQTATPQSTQSTPTAQTAQAAQTPQTAQAAALPSAMQALVAQTLLGGLSNLAAGLSSPLQNAQAQLAAGLPLTPEQKALLQGSLFAQAATTTQQTTAQDKQLPLPSQQQQTARSEAELRNLPQQLPADAKRQAETLDRSLAKQTAEAQQQQQPGKTLAEAKAAAAEAKAAEAQARAEAKALRDGADSKARANLTETTRPVIGENSKQNSQLSNSERRPLGTTESLRNALDWVGQQVRGLGADAKTDSEGVTAMRVVAGLVVAATVVGVAIAVLYAIRVAFVVP